jgi:hypothetical protein
MKLIFSLDFLIPQSFIFLKFAAVYKFVIRLLKSPYNSHFSLLQFLGEHLFFKSLVNLDISSES